MLARKYKDNSSQEVLTFLGEELRRFRLQSNIASAKEVALELSMGENQVYVNEQGKALVSVRSLYALMDLYGLNQKDREYLIELRNLVLDKRDKEKGE